jgi:hypothetical protein
MTFSELSHFVRTSETWIRLCRWSVLLLCIACAQQALAQEYFGKFRDALKGEFIDATPRPKFKLLNDFRYEDPNGLLWSVPSKKEVDGASIPQAFWSFIGGPFEGNYIRASVIHDYYCDIKTRTQHDTHRNFYYGMRAAGVDLWQAKFMYWAVATFGPKWTLTQRVEQDLVCRTVDNQLACSQVPVLKKQLVSLPDVDLSDPDILAAALSKASTVARSLKTSNGAVLDVSAKGPVPANLSDIAKSAEQYRAVFSTKAFIKNPAQLGVLSQWNAAGLEQVQPWENNRVPNYNEAVELRSNAVRQIESGSSFKLTPNTDARLRDRINYRALEMKSAGPR